MPTKPVKKTTAKSAATKKTTTKKTVAAKRPAAKKAVKKTVETVEQVIAPEMPTCPCGADCKCGAGEHCQCGHDCKCVRGGSRFGRFMIKLIMVLIVFALGFGAAKLLDCDEFRDPRVDFDDGCLVVSSVKCPQLQALLPVMDIDQNGCITSEEYRAVKTELHRQMRAQMND